MGNETLIENFLEYKKQHNRSKRKEGLSERTLELYRVNLNALNRDIKNKPFKQVTKQDIEKHLNKYEQNTKNSLIPLFQQFFRFVYHLDKDDKLPDCIRSFEIRRIDGNNIESAERIVTPNEYALLMEQCRKPIHKAILEAVWVCGGRLNEVHSMRVGGVSFDGRFTKIIVYKSKTTPREISYDGHAEHLLKWHDSLCPFVGQKDKPLWVVQWKGELKPVNDKYLWDVIDNACKKTGLRHITTHDFRHAVASKMLKNGVPDTFVKLTMGWTRDSQMLRVYDHNKNKDYEEWMKRREQQIKLPYELLEKQKQELEKKHEKEIQDLKKEFTALRNVILRRAEFRKEYQESL